MQRGVCDHFVDFENKLFFIFLTLSFVDESLDGFLNEFKKKNLKETLNKFLKLFWEKFLLWKKGKGEIFKKILRNF